MNKSLIVFILSLFFVGFLQATELSKLKAVFTKSEAACANAFYVKNEMYGTYLVAGQRKHYDNDDDRVIILSDSQYDQWKLPGADNGYYLQHISTGYWFDLAYGNFGGDLFIDKTYLAGNYVYQLWIFQQVGSSKDYQIVYKKNPSWVLSANTKYTVAMANTNTNDKAQLWRLQQ